ncbi:keratin-associated protein 17-1-like [Chenopodium quinoa]|uniref:keratin-associated protein 17-1-like n=1 Tax=Chenopodium quinoa TaxID=63459 RepID=UPI000B7976C5|nr:keratin-associated protein 17-1-like [Chenopodium quinoa]
MEGKLVFSNKKNYVLKVFFVLALVQMMLVGNVQGCAGVGEGCGAFNWCCNGGSCSDSLSGGVCVYDSFSGCKGFGESCGFFDAPCCGKRVCSATLSGGTCSD